MAEARIPVDLLNPGQVFACLGFLEAADQLLGDAEGAFDWSVPGDTRFHLRAAGTKSPAVAVLEFLERATAIAEAVEGSPNVGGWRGSWGDIGTRPRDAGYPYPEPDSPATLVCTLVAGDQRIQLDHWGEETRKTGRDNVKLWAGAGGYPGAALARDALELVRGRAIAAALDPFALSSPQSSSFRLDWRRDYIPLDAGFSLNSHPNMEPSGYPLVELLAVLGLTNARPRRPDARDKLAYVYGVVGRDATTPSVWIRPALLRAALGTAGLPFPSRQFRMFLGWPGQENQARSITSVTEETSS